MKNIKLTGILVSAGLIIILCTGLLSYNSTKENNSKNTPVATATGSSDINTESNNDETFEVDKATTVEEDITSSQSSNSTKTTINQSTLSNSTEESNTLDKSNNITTNTNTNEKDNSTNDLNNSTSTQPKPEVNKPVLTPPTANTPDNENTPPTPSANFVAEIEQAIFQQVNAERANNGLPILTYNNTMQKYARIKSQDMGDRDYFAHENPEGELITTQMQKEGVSYQAWGENIAYIQSSVSNTTLANQFMTNWMNSPGHRANILSDNFTSIGIGIYKVGDTYYATQEFYK